MSNKEQMNARQYGAAGPLDDELINWGQSDTPLYEEPDYSKMSIDEIEADNARMMGFGESVDFYDGLKNTELSIGTQVTSGAYDSVVDKMNKAYDYVSDNGVFNTLYDVATGTGEYLYHMTNYGLSQQFGYNPGESTLNYHDMVVGGIANTLTEGYNAYQSGDYYTASYIAAPEFAMALIPGRAKALNNAPNTSSTYSGDIFDVNFIGPKFPDEIDIYRVDDLNFSPRIFPDGTIPVSQTKKGGERALWVNFGQPERAIEFAKKIENRANPGIPQITTAKVDGSLFLKLRQKAIYDKSEAAKLNPNATLFSDLPSPDQYGLRTSGDIELLRNAIDRSTVRVVDPIELLSNQKNR